METVIYKDSPLAAILEASGERINNDEPLVDTEPVSPTTTEPVSFAPRGFPKLSQPSKTKRERPTIAQTVYGETPWIRLRRTCMDVFRWRISQREEVRALEQLRYTIIASQLLDDRASTNGLGRRSTISQLVASHKEIDQLTQYTITGLILTAGSAFACALSIWWATRPSRGRLSKTRLASVCAFFAVISLFVYGFCIRQYHRYARSHTIETASAMINNAQAFDTNAQAASNLIQEVELVSRGYRLSSPLPPASRVEDGKSQSRRCARLRRVLRSALDSMMIPHVNAYHHLYNYANDVDLDRYFDLYELSRSDIGEVEESTIARTDSVEELESIRALKVDLHRLLMARKMLLCTILALDVDTKSKALDWIGVTEIMKEISSTTAASVSSLEKILSEEERSDLPATPKSPMSPGRERFHHQARRFTTLSQGLRSLQAKMHILREESDKALGSSDEVTALGSSLLEQYDAIGTDLRTLMTDWEEGRATLTASIGKHERRVSLNSAGMLFSRSPTPSSLGGITEVGSPTEAFKLWTGDPMPSLDAGSSDEEVFEAMASPRPRNSLTREERILKMREDRARQVSARERLDAGRFMVKELETVIKARPRGKTTGRVTSI